MKQIARSARDFFSFQNIIAIIGIAVAAVFAYLDIKGGTPHQLSEATIALLTTLALVQIIVQYKSAGLATKVDAIESNLRKFGSSPSPPLRTRTELPALQQDAPNARDVLIIAQSAAIVLRQIEFFVDRLRQGATIRLALTNPDCLTAIESMIPLSEISRDGFLADMQVAKGLVERIREQAAGAEQLQVRVYDYATTLSLVMVDGHLPTGYIIVEMVPYRVSPSLRPHLYVTSEDNPTWYVYFREICERIWQDAMPLPSFVREAAA